MIANIIVPLIAGFGGVYLGIRYSELITKRQEKAALVLILQEYYMLLKRTTMYYEQMLKQKVSFSTLFEISDSSTFNKLVEVCKDNKIIKTVLRLKANFFQVVRYANKASESMALSNVAAASGNEKVAVSKQKEALFAQSMAITFFAGDLLVGGEFSRERHREYIQYFNTLLKYLQEINTPSPFGQLMNEIFPSLREESKNTDDFIDECRNMIEL